MQIQGEWFPCDDGVVRPVIRAEVLADNGTWQTTVFLLDIGADRTVFSADLLLSLDFELTAAGGEFVGIGGTASAVLVETQISLKKEDGQPVFVRGRFTGVTDPGALDMSLLGRDITDLFAAIVDRPGNQVCLLGQNHRYKIEYLGS